MSLFKKKFTFLKKRIKWREDDTFTGRCKIFFPTTCDEYAEYCFDIRLRMCSRGDTISKMEAEFCARNPQFVTELGNLQGSEDVYCEILRFGASGGQLSTFKLEDVEFKFLRINEYDILSDIALSYSIGIESTSVTKIKHIEHYEDDF